MAKNSKIVLGVCGSIAAYKAAYLVRLLVKNNFEVKVVMTPSAAAFVSPLTLSTLSRNPVMTGMAEGNEWQNHVELGLWADALVIAPATANTIGKMAGGICDNLLLAVYLSAKCPVFIAPAMDLDMWKHPATRGNIEKLRSFGNHIIDVDFGELASGLTGEGRLAEPEAIFRHLSASLSQKKSPAPDRRFEKTTVLITGGPTFEPIDPVRFIGNKSSGKMGLHLALEFARRGASVTLVMGPSDLRAVHPNIKQVDVTTAEEMYAECIRVFAKADMAILAAAVADFTPEKTSSSKIKKENAPLAIRLKKTKDILAELGKRKRPGQLLIGFALETDNETANAREKLVKKNLDMIILNSLRDKGAGFGVDTNKVSILDKSGNKVNFNLKLKSEVAKDIAEHIGHLIHV